ncbi:arylalkylamine N-acetyltransferase 1-like isoform X2 [Leptopilina boulardi]|uniref:arylalkylamine N-acetyltransferase 1-like isoform X2 n=1 Tax=Leptopilina boulardi TaxID=63433 RepID=UPI0021F57108|nr:arylalkylamine N-acetyltransferase 1-like isoform X2 [Leptopilina boulardi]
MSNENLTIVVIQENRFPDVINHLRYNFFADEPLNKAVGLCQPGDSHYELEQHCLQTLKQGYSRMLIDNKGTIAGTVLNGIVQRGEREEAERRLAEMNDKKFQTIFGLLYKVNEKIDLFSKYNVDDLFECRILSVDDRYRGRGLANVLVKESLETAKNAGFKIFKTDATGLYSQKVFLKYGFKTEAEILYLEIDENIRPEPPHQALKLMVKILE